MRLSRSLATAAAVLAAVVALPLPAWSQSQDARPTGVSLTPGVVERELPGRAIDLSFALANNEPVPVDVALTVQRLSQTLDGAFGYEEHLPLVVDPPHARLLPGEKVAVRVTGSVPDGAPALYAGVLAEPRAPQPAGGNVEIRTRVAALLLLTTPGAHRRGVEVADVRLTPTPEKDTYRVSAVLRNTGEIHERPRGTVDISLPGGPVLGTATLNGGVLIPGAARRLDGGLWTAPPEPPARVQLDVSVTDPDASGGGTVALEQWDGDDASSVVPSSDLNELGGGEDSGPLAPGGRSWLVWLALALLFVMAAALLWERGRPDGMPATGPPHQFAPDSH